LRVATARLTTEVPVTSVSADDLSRFFAQHTQLQGALAELYGRIVDASGDSENEAIDREVTNLQPQIQGFLEGVNALLPAEVLPIGAEAPPATANVVWAVKATQRRGKAA